MDLVFYDGGCGLCHRAVAFLARRDRDGSRFRFAPLDGPTFRTRVPAELRAALPDSVAVLTDDGTLLLRSHALRHALRRLGGPWHLPALLLALIPRPVADWAYDRVARARGGLFRKPDGPCPVLPRDLRERFLD